MVFKRPWWSKFSDGMKAVNKSTKALRSGAAKETGLTPDSQCERPYSKLLYSFFFSGNWAVSVSKRCLMHNSER